MEVTLHAIMAMPDSQRSRLKQLCIIILPRQSDLRLVPESANSTKD